VELQNSFDVPAEPDRVWDFLLDIEAVAPCMPGAELTEVVDDRTYRGRVRVKLGPVSLTYKGQVIVEERDAAAHRLVMRADGAETGGKGTASAKVLARVEPLDGSGSRVSIVTDMTLSGPAAQYGRGMVADVSRRLTGQFADTLREQLEARRQGTPAPAPTAKEVAGFRLALWTLGQALRRGVGRLAGGRARD
jgi:carbon monoxide dehydrogenase subunit G